jgi:ABC-type glycerol-3-phosphate transport system substrate-binding protein
VNRSRIAVAALALFVVLAACVVLVLASHDSRSGRVAGTSSVPHWLAYHRQLLAEAAKYERKHPGVSCDTDPPHNVYATQLTCTGPDGQELGLMLLADGQP